MTPAPWTPDEIALLRAHPTVPPSRLLKLFPNRTVDAIRRKRSNLGMAGVAAGPWRPSELAIMRANLTLTCTALATMLPGRSPGAVSERLSYERKRAGVDVRALARNKARERAVKSATRSRERKAVTFPPEPRPLGVPFQTTSGLWAIRLGSGVVPYIPTLYGTMNPPPVVAANSSLAV